MAFQRVPLKFYTKYLAHTLKGVILVLYNVKISRALGFIESSYTFLKCSPALSQFLSNSVPLSHVYKDYISTTKWEKVTNEMNITDWSDDPRCSPNNRDQWQESQWLRDRQGAVAMLEIPPKLILNSNLIKSPLSTTALAINQSLRNFAWNMTVSLPFSVQNRKTILWLPKLSQACKRSWDLKLRRLIYFFLLSHP